jgi:hypothetical protein
VHLASAPGTAICCKRTDDVVGAKGGEDTCIQSAVTVSSKPSAGRGTTGCTPTESLAIVDGGGTQAETVARGRGGTDSALSLLLLLNCALHGIEALDADALVGGRDIQSVGLPFQGQVIGGQVKDVAQLDAWSRAQAREAQQSRRKKRCGGGSRTFADDIDGIANVNVEFAKGFDELRIADEHPRGGRGRSDTGTSRRLFRVFWREDVNHRVVSERPRSRLCCRQAERG